MIKILPKKLIFKPNLQFFNPILSDIFYLHVKGFLGKEDKKYLIYAILNTKIYFYPY